MKGMVFNVLSEMVEESFGEDMWEDLIDDVQPANGGAYTSGDTYDAAELLSYVSALSKRTNTPVPDLVRAFGAYTLPKLRALAPSFFENHDLKSFFKSIHDVVHVEVKKLYPHAVLPTFEYEDSGPDGLTMIYHSRNRLCFFAEGLMEGAANHFEQSLEIDHAECMHQGAEKCRFELTIGARHAVGA